MRFEGVIASVVSPHFDDHSIDRAAELPVMAFIDPNRMSVNMDEGILHWLGQSPNVKAITSAILIPAWKTSLTLAAGCSVIEKPAEQSSPTAPRVEELASKAGLPNGVLQALPSDGPSVGEPKGMTPGVNMIGFTVSTETGWRFLRSAADNHG